MLILPRRRVASGPFVTSGSDATAATSHTYSRTLSAGDYAICVFAEKSGGTGLEPMTVTIDGNAATLRQSNDLRYGAEGDILYDINIASGGTYDIVLGANTGNLVWSAFSIYDIGARSWVSGSGKRYAVGVTVPYDFPSPHTLQTNTNAGDMVIGIATEFDASFSTMTGSDGLPATPDFSDNPEDVWFVASFAQTNAVGGTPEDFTIDADGSSTLKGMVIGVWR